MLKDQFGRRINYLRLSVTDRCDFRCVYCMAEEMTFVPRQQLLTLEEMSLIAQTFVELGVNKIRLTGGEPLIRRNIDQLLANLGQLSGLDELTLTTNGSHLAEHIPALKAAGVKRINISLDSLNEQRFKNLTRTGNLPVVLNNIDEALAAGFNIKINSVILKGRNDDEVIKLVNFALNRKIDIAFIEEMPLGKINDHQRQDVFISSDELRELISTKYPLTKISNEKNNAGPADYWKLNEYPNRIGFISPHSHNFCGDCNRVRLTATGKLLLCLGNEHAVDLKALVRRYPNEPDKLKSTIIDAMSMKPERHYFNLEEEPSILRFMNTTGG